MSSGSSVQEEQHVEVIYTAPTEVSSEEPPMEEWSSLLIDIPQENEKKIRYEKGLYDPGSGEICTKYVTMSASSILRHPYYNYPAVIDPGIEEALLEPEDEIVYPSDGQDLYLAVCKEMNQCPVRTFHEGLLNEIIDLKYYCVNPRGVRAMSMALKNNRNVAVLNLTDNFLSKDACFHLGDMLKTNTALQELNLSGCKIGPQGVKNILAGLIHNKTLNTLNLNRNALGDTGIEYLATSIFQGLNVKQMLLSYNNISGKSAGVLAEAFETHNKFTHLDLSWNNFCTPGGTQLMLARLSENIYLQELNLAWNALTGPRIAGGIKAVLKAPNLRLINLSNNKLTGEAVSTIIENLGKAKKLITFDISYNPMTPEDAIQVLNKMRFGNVKVQNLLMESVFVNGEFLSLLKAVMALKSRKSSVITYGGVIGAHKPEGPDMRDLVLNRAEFIGTRSKKNPVDIALVAMRLLKDGMEIMPSKDFGTALTSTGAPFDNGLIEEIINTFSGPKTPKSKTVNIVSLVDYIHRKWPDRKLPPTPPPELAPAPPPPNPKAAAKGKKK